jgi:hypothetical protein
VGCEQVKRVVLRLVVGAGPIRDDFVGGRYAVTVGA